MSTTVQSPARSLTAVAKPSLTREQLWLPVAIVLAAIIALAGWMLLVSPVRDETSSITAQTATVTTQSDALRRQISTLAAQQADLPKYQAELAAAQAALPVDTGVPALLRTLQSLGTATGTAVTTLTADSPTLLNGSGTAAAVAGAVYQLPVSITAKGSTPALTQFLSQLQSKAPRALLVTDVHLSGDGDSQKLDITATAYLQPTASNSGGR